MKSRSRKTNIAGKWATLFLGLLIVPKFAFAQNDAKKSPSNTPAGPVAAAASDPSKARELFDKGVKACKAGDFDMAIEDFKQAKNLDPSLTDARLYLASAYAGRYIPGAPSDENVRQGQQAIDEYKEVLANDPNNLTAIDGIGAILYNMAGGPSIKLDEIRGSQVLSGAPHLRPG